MNHISYQEVGGIRCTRADHRHLHRILGTGRQFLGMIHQLAALSVL